MLSYCRRRPSVGRSMPATSEGYSALNTEDFRSWCSQLLIKSPAGKWRPHKGCRSFFFRWQHGFSRRLTDDSGQTLRPRSPDDKIALEQPEEVWPHVHKGRRKQTNSNKRIHRLYIGIMDQHILVCCYSISNGNIHISMNKEWFHAPPNNIS